MSGAEYFVFLVLITIVVFIVLILLVRKNGFILALSTSGALLVSTVLRLSGPTYNGNLDLRSEWIQLTLKVSIGENGIAAYIIALAVGYLFLVSLQTYARHEELKLTR